MDEARPAWVADLGLALLLAVLFGCLCAVHPAKLLFYWDSAQYGLAVLDFDPATHRPQPPGYPLYILLCRLAAWLTGDLTHGLVLASALGGCATVALTFAMARGLMGRWQAALAALAVALSPLMWTQGQLPLPYTLESASAAATMLTVLWASRRGGLLPVAVAGAAWGLALGLRPQLVWLLFPAVLLTLGTACHSESPRRLGAFSRTAVCLGVALGIGAGWIAYCAWASGGWGNYWASVQDTLWWARKLSLRRPHSASESHLVAHQRASFSAARRLVVGSAWMLALAAWLPSYRWPLLRVAVPWALVPLAFYGFCYCGRRGYLCLVVPPLAMLIVAGVEGLAKLMRERHRPAFLVAAAGATVFLVVQHAPLAKDVFRVERNVHRRLRAARALDPNTSLLLARGDYRTLSFHVPECHVWWLAGITWLERPGLRGRIFGSHRRRDTLDGRWLPVADPALEARVPDGITRIVTFEPRYARTLAGGRMSPRLIAGIPSWTVDVRPGSVLSIGPGRWSVGTGSANKGNYGPQGRN